MQRRSGIWQSAEKSLHDLSKFGVNIDSVPTSSRLVSPCHSRKELRPAGRFVPSCALRKRGLRKGGRTGHDGPHPALPACASQRRSVFCFLSFLAFWLLFLFLFSLGAFFFFFLRCPWKGKEIKESPIRRRWHNFHFSSPTTAPRTPALPGAPRQRTPGGRRGAGAGSGRDAGTRGPPPAPSRSGTGEPSGPSPAGRGRSHLARALQEGGSAGEPRSDAARMAPQTRAPSDSHFRFLPPPPSETHPPSTRRRGRGRRSGLPGAPARGTKNFGRDVPAAAAAVKSPNFP